MTSTVVIRSAASDASRKADLAAEQVKQQGEDILAEQERTAQHLAVISQQRDEFRRGLDLVLGEGSQFQEDMHRAMEASEELEAGLEQMNVDLDAALDDLGNDLILLDQALVSLNELLDADLPLLESALTQLEQDLEDAVGRLDQKDIELGALNDALDDFDTQFVVVSEKADDAKAAADVAIVNTQIEYSVSSSETNPPTTGWSTDTPNRTPGTFVWMRTVVTKGSGQTQTTNPAIVTGNTGSPGSAGSPGRGIESTSIGYQSSTSGINPPSEWLPDPPPASPGMYVWTRTLITFTDDTTQASYSVGRYGSDGEPGDDGVGVQSTQIRYQRTNSGTDIPTSWTTSIPLQTDALPFLNSFA